MQDPQELCEKAVECFKEDPGEAFRLFREAAEAGYPNGYFGLAEMKFNGYGVDKDVEGAAELYKAAAEAGHPPSMYRLGLL